uniref:DUF3996 domain-containing protein n=1 Tax=Dictyoglomus thermophilum TaxID=14 RepID=A0A7C3RKQ4_DICTH
MRRLILFVSTLIFLFSVTYAGNFGVGIIAGEPTGISLRLWQDKVNAFDFGIAWSIDANILHISADYVTHNFGIFKPTSGSMPFYYGIGLRILAKDNTNFGVRVPLGIVFMPKGTTLDFFFEMVPTLNLVPATNLDVDGAIGFRYYF